MGVASGSPNASSFLAHDDGGAGVLAHGKDSLGGNLGIAEEVEGHEAIICGSLGIFQDSPQLLQMPGSQKVRDVVKGFSRKHFQGGGINLQYLLAFELHRTHEIP